MQQPTQQTVSSGIPGTAHLKSYDRGNKEPIIICDIHKSVKALFKLLKDEEIITVCGQCFFDEVEATQLEEAESLEDIMNGAATIGDADEFDIT